MSVLVPPEHVHRLNYPGDLTGEDPLCALVHGFYPGGTERPIYVPLTAERSPWRDHDGYPVALVGAAYDPDTDHTTLYLDFGVVPAPSDTQSTAREFVNRGPGGRT